MDMNDLARTVSALGTRYVEEYTRNLQRCATLLNDMAARGTGELDPLELQKRHAQFVIAESPRIMERLAEAGVSYYAALANTGVEAMNSYVEQVLGMDSAASRRSAGGAQAAPAGLLFHGERGHNATNAFLVTNNRDEAIDVTFDIGELESADGGVRFKPKATFTPSRCKLPPRAQQVVQCSLQLSRDFAAGQAHSGHIQVVGCPEMAMRISVEVEEPAAGAEKKTAAGAQEKPAVPRKKAAAAKRKRRPPSPRA
jgi:hypothetical protein